ncbi:hypothetical protein AB6C66_15720 [Vibrio splendidus]
MRVKILLDHVSREIDFAVNLKKTIEDNSLGEVVVFHQDYIADPGGYDFFRTTFDGQYDVIIVPSYHVKRTPALLLRALASRAKLVVYHSEQIIREYIEVDKLNLDYLKQFDSHIAAHFVWGKHYARKLIDKSRISPDKIFIVGNYKMDFVSQISNCIKKQVLLASDYKPADMTDEGAVLFEKEYGVKYDLIRRDNCRKARKHMLDFIERESKLFPHITFLLRPHPGESLCEYNLILSKNVKLSQPGSTYSSDLNASDFVLGFTSTSCMEVVNTKKRFFSIDFFDFDKEDLSPHKVLLEWKNSNEVHQIIKSLDEGQLPQRNIDIEKKLDKLISNEKNVGNNIVIALKKIVSVQYSYTTKVTALDILPLAKLTVICSFKVLLIKIAKVLNGKLGTNIIRNTAMNSYQSRQKNNEIVTDELINDFMTQQKGYIYDESILMVKSSSGIYFN